MYFGFQGMRIAYGKRTVLEDVSMDFKRGQITAIIGPNGCGKSSLLKTVSRAVTPAAGTAVLEDKPLQAHSAKELAKRIAYLPQTCVSPKDIDVRTLVSYGRFPYLGFGHRLAAQDKRMVEQALSLTGLSPLAGRPLNSLSGGERQRAWVAMAVCRQPEILLLDEPTTHLDIGYQVEVLELVRELRDRLRITIVLVLHDMNFTARYADSLYALKDGRVYGCGSPQEMVTQEKLRDVFGIGSQILQDAKNGCPFVIPEKLRAGEA